MILFCKWPSLLFFQWLHQSLPKRFAPLRLANVRLLSGVQRGAEAGIQGTREFVAFMHEILGACPIAACEEAQGPLFDH
jgi:hypothetical protein